MYCILVYDVNEKRVGKMLKHFRQYLNWIQNSVFEGELTKGQITEMMFQAEKIMKDEEDSIILFTMQNDKYLEKKFYGLDKSSLTSNIL